MRIDQIYLSGHRLDFRFTRCAVASIRRFYPDIPICLIKDELHGGYDTRELERLFQVELFDTETSRFGWGMGKLEPLFLERRQRCLILDSDIVFAGRVLDRLDQFSEDFVVERCEHAADDIREHYFDLDAALAAFDRFRYPDPAWVFNGGQLVATTGILRREDFFPFIAFEQPRRVLFPNLFPCGEQGVLNFVLLNKLEHGELTVRRDDFMKWPPAMKPGSVGVEDLQSGDLDFLLHWAGRKHTALAAHPLGEVLRYFEVQYYRKLHGR